MPKNTSSTNFLLSRKSVPLPPEGKAKMAPGRTSDSAPLSEDKASLTLCVSCEFASQTSSAKTSLTGSRPHFLKIKPR